jgi:hypothetical protein
MAGIKSLDELNLREMLDNFHLYSGLPDGLVQLPLPDYVLFEREYPVPKTSEELMESICYGQRLFLVREEDNDFGVIVRMMDGYYYPLVENKPWDEDNALLFGKKVLTLLVKDLYPIAMHMVKLVGEMAERESKLLHREPSKIERAAGIEKLNVFSDLINLDFLRDAMKCTVPEVLLTPYNECLVRFMLAKEQADFQERYFELMKEDATPKGKYHA